MDTHLSLQLQLDAEQPVHERVGGHWFNVEHPALVAQHTPSMLGVESRMRHVSPDIA